MLFLPEEFTLLAPPHSAFEGDWSRSIGNYNQSLNIPIPAAFTGIINHLTRTFPQHKPGSCLHAKFNLNQSTSLCQGPEGTCRLWLPWVASAGTLTHTHTSSRPSFKPKPSSQVWPEWCYRWVCLLPRLSPPHPGLLMAPVTATSSALHMCTPLTNDVGWKK